MERELGCLSLYRVPTAVISRYTGPDQKIDWNVLLKRFYPIGHIDAMTANGAAGSVKGGLRVRQHLSGWASITWQ
jgi:hypothetical protein